MRYFVYILFSILFIPVYAMACTCMPVEANQARAAYDRADIIIKARVMQVSPGWGSNGPLLKAQIIEVIKSDTESDLIPEIISVNYNSNPEACGYTDMMVDKEYIMALYDTRQISLTNANARGYGYRMMNKCELNLIEYHLNQLNTENF